MNKDSSFLIFGLPEPYAEVNFYNRRKNWSMDEHDHAYFQFIFVVSGILLLRCSGKEYSLSRGQLCVIPPGHFHSLKSDTGYFQLGINLQPNKDSKGIIGLLEDYIQEFTVLEHNELLDYLPALEKECKHLTKLSKIKAASILDGIMTSCVEKALNGAEDNFKNHLLTFLGMHLNQRISLYEVAKELSVSQSHLERLVKKEFGCGVIELFNQLRISKACSQLSNSTYSIQEISEQLGFYDTSHFSHFFKQKIKISPTEYRKRKNWSN